MNKIIDLSTQRVAVVGYGSFATAIMKILTEANHKITWYIKNDIVREYIQENKINPKYISDIKFDIEKITIEKDIVRTFKNSDILIISTPAAFLENTLIDLTIEDFKDKIIISAIKGILPNSLNTVIEFLNEVYDCSYDNMAILTGPCHAEEIAREKLSYITIHSKSRELSELVAPLFNTNYIKINCGNDIFGSEYSAILKNVYAIGVGVALGIGNGDNFIAVFVTAAAREMAKFIDRLYPDAERDFLTSPYLGDFIVTAYSMHSRNRRLGLMLGKGYSVQSAILEMSMVAEGYYATEGAYKMINSRDKFLKDEMPIINSIYNILYKKASPKKEIEKLSKLFV